MKKFLIQVVLLIILTFLALGYFFSGFQFSTGSSNPFFPTTLTTGQVKINDDVFIVEIADNKDERSKGLGGRQSLASGSGMLFIFVSPDKYQFWMKGLSFPLDFIYINGNEVVDIIKNAAPPRPDQSDDQLPIYIPAVPVDKVLEVNAGTVDALDIRIGDRVEITQ